MDILFDIIIVALCWGVAGWILMLILGAFGLTIGYWPCVGICIGISLLKLLL